MKKIKPFYLNVKRMGNYIYDRYIDESGVEQTRTVKYQPTLFVKLNNPTNYQKKNKKHDLYGSPVYPVKFETMTDARNYLEQNKEMGAEVLGMDSFEYAYISDVYKDIDPKDPTINRLVRKANVDIEVTAPEMPDPSNPQYPIDAITHYDSIEDIFYVFDLTTHSDGTTRLWDPTKSLHTPETLSKIKYYPFDTERDLLAAYAMLYSEKPPVILTGWNCEKFDVPYIIGRIIRIFGEDAPKLMSPFKRYSSRNIRTRYGEQEIYELSGIHVIDYMDLYKKIGGGTPPNFKLDTISEIELGYGKVEYDCEINELRDKSHQLYIDYNIGDVRNVKEIDERRNFLSLTVFMTHYMGMNMIDILGSIRAWDTKIFKNLKKKNVAIPMVRNHTKQAYEGAFVKNPLIGAFRWIISFDLTSLYPSIIRELGISFETFMGMLDNMPSMDDLINGRAPGFTGDYAIAPNGAMYTKDQVGIIVETITEVFFERVDNKSKAQIAGRNVEAIKHALRVTTETSTKRSMDFDYIKPFDKNDLQLLDTLTKSNLKQLLQECEDVRISYDTAQNALKLAINSLYGALGTIWFRYYSLHNAEAITSFGRLAINWIIRKVNEYLNKFLNTSDVDYVIAADTDSIYINVESVVELVDGENRYKTNNELVDFLDRFAKTRIEPMINESFEELAVYMNARENLMHMDREAIAGSGIKSKGLGGFWVAKKAYAISVFDMEGRRYEEPELKIMGLATQKSSTPIVVRSSLRTALEKMLIYGEAELQNYYMSANTEFTNASYLNIAGKSRVKTLAKYTTADFEPPKGTPYAIRGALAYQKATQGIRSAMPIFPDDEVNTVALIEPNPFNSHVMSWPAGEELPVQIREEVLKYIDYESQFEKTFLKPLQGFTDAAGISYKPQTDMSVFFE